MKHYNSKRQYDPAAAARRAATLLTLDEGQKFLLREIYDKSFESTFTLFFKEMPQDGRKQCKIALNYWFMTTNTDSIDINFLATLHGPAGRHAKQIMTAMNPACSIEGG